MTSAYATKTNEKTYTVDEAMEMLLEGLDGAIDDMEAGRIQSVDEAWAEIDSII